MDKDADTELYKYRYSYEISDRIKDCRPFASDELICFLMKSFLRPLLRSCCLVRSLEQLRNYEEEEFCVFMLREDARSVFDKEAFISFKIHTYRRHMLRVENKILIRSISVKCR